MAAAGSATPLSQVSRQRETPRGAAEAERTHRPAGAGEAASPAAGAGAVTTRRRKSSLHASHTSPACDITFKVAILGDNGVGKTTLILGERGKKLEASSIGPGVNVRVRVTDSTQRGDYCCVCSVTCAHFSHCMRLPWCSAKAHQRVCSRVTCPGQQVKLFKVGSDVLRVEVSCACAVAHSGKAGLTAAPPPPPPPNLCLGLVSFCFSFGRAAYQFWDCPGAHRMMPLLPHYCCACAAFVFVYDGSFAPPRFASHLCVPLPHPSYIPRFRSVVVANSVLPASQC